MRRFVAGNRTLDGQVVGLGSAGGPDNLPWVGVNQVSDLASSVFNGRFRLPPVSMGTRSRITKHSVKGQVVHHV